MTKKGVGDGCGISGDMTISLKNDILTKIMSDNHHKPGDNQKNKKMAMMTSSSVNIQYDYFFK